MHVGDFEIASVVNGGIRLDGGAMFGVVPKVLWSGRLDTDDSNRVLLRTRTLIAMDRRRKRVILVDTGCGTKWASDAASRYGIEPDPGAIERALRGMGSSEDAVTDVVITHLHFDHNGGLTEWTDASRSAVRLRYPRARHWIHRCHMGHAMSPHDKDRASFVRHDFEILAGASVLNWVEGDSPDPPMDGVEWWVSHGHTPFQLHPRFRGANGGPDLLFIGDIMPTAAHARVNWVMAYDVLPMTTIDEKRSILHECHERGLLLALPHDPTSGVIRIIGSADRPIATEVMG